MKPLVMRRFAPGVVRATGWLREQLGRSASGLTGRLPFVWDDVGPSSGWLGGDGECWERGPYYVRGLVTLAHVLGDGALVAQARPWIDWTLASQGDDGCFGPRANDDWWARMPMVDALRLHHEATGDARVMPFLTRYFRHQRAALPSQPLTMWAPARGGDAADAVCWLYDRTGDAWLLDLIDVLHTQTTDWTTEFLQPVPSDAFELAHGVNRAMALRAPAVWWRRTGDPRHREAIREGWMTTMAHHGQVHGLYSCDEMLHGTDPRQGTELCTVVELIASFASALEVTGEPWLADAIERVAYNALPAMLAPDLCTHQYYAQANQSACVPGAHAFHYHHDTDLLFGVAPGFGCCAANMHIGWPGLVRALFMRSDDGGVVAAVLGPGSVRFEAQSRAVVVTSDTAYPFEDEVRFVVGTPEPVAFPLTVRIPAWTDRATLALGDRVVWQGPGGRFQTVERTWGDGDVLRLALNAPVRSTTWTGGKATERGALVFTRPIAESWQVVRGTPPFADYEVRPIDTALRVEPQQPVAAQPWTVATAPLVLDRADGVRLVPFGCARLRETVA